MNTFRPAMLVLICMFASYSVNVAQGYDCRPLKCGQMSHCAEASFKLEICGHLARDRDRDGIPCEKICGKTRKIYQARVREQAGRYPIERLNAAGLTETRSELAPVVSVKQKRFSCSGKSRCGEMVSCAEATYYLQQCGAKKLDGNRDGIPCNSLCR